MAEPVRLGTLAHGGGCKLDPAVLRRLLADQPAAGPFERLLVGTTDSFPPMADDRFDFGRIAAAKALSDLFAMGALPNMALAILGIPFGKIPPETITAILKGGAVRRNADAQAGDALILSKPLGVGVYAAAIETAALPESGDADVIATTARLDRVGADLARRARAHRRDRLRPDRPRARTRPRRRASDAARIGRLEAGPADLRVA